MIRGFKLFRTTITITLCGFSAWTFANNAEYPPLIGHGYDGMRLQQLQQSCVKGTLVNSPHIEDTTEFKRVENWNDFLTQLNFSIPGSIYLNASSEVAKFAVRARDSNTSTTYVMTTVTSVSKDVLMDPAVTWDEPDHARFQDVCGTQYVSVVEYGGLLHVGLKFAFSDSQYKEKFDAGGALQSLTGLKSKIDSLGQDVRTHSSLEIFFHQVGGELDELHQLFDSSDIMSCSLDHFEPCENLIKDVFSYSSHFVKAVENGKYQTIGYKTVTYPNRERHVEDPVVKRERGRLLDELEQLLSDADTIHMMKSNSSELQVRNNEKCHLQCLQRISNEISSNIRSLKEAVIMSFHEPEEFKKYGILSSLELRKYEMPHKEERAHRFLRKNGHYLIGTVLVAALLPIVYKYYHLLPLPWAKRGFARFRTTSTGQPLSHSS